MIILGMSGKARSGKSTLCRALYDAAEKVGWEVVVKPFAGPLKHHVTHNLGYSKDTHPEEYRSYCQSEGAAKRKKDPDHWVKLWLKDMRQEWDQEMKLSQQPVLYLVDDVRYPNEIKTLKSSQVNATILFVKHQKRKIEDPTGEWRNHESEALANKYENTADVDLKQTYDFVVHNDKNEDDINNWAETFVKYLSDNDPCLCESCIANYEMREPDVDKLDLELKEFLNDILGEEEDLDSEDT
jgi:hypothetical protein